MDEIVNRVANSVLQVFDLEDYFPKEKIVELDISQWLFGGFILKETEFRDHLKQHDWSHYKDVYVALFCSEEAILPAWAYALVSVYLEPFALKVVNGTKKDVLLSVYQQTLETLDYSSFQDKPIILKGCSNKPVPQEVYVLATQKLVPFAKSIMFGEACSAVPLYKKK
ncbi:hypothetical protein FSS13T_12570 [Flavobacterium saliperosum S13]|uniref:DUF2480 family protein n=2 Tax=Flavobacterium saliperosum TaxID=329186 RepID=A0A1G4W2H9_9FLAO|nr:DUF2480 family protein [Flavobacterium saliperosum]ESU26105.1 hypothetical protein FSS13T_12570 [Flavobacterium saliperosum S13]SCX15672.1 Protein of unknown function [Flavobacterium saliperosum]